LTRLVTDLQERVESQDRNFRDTLKTKLDEERAVTHYKLSTEINDKVGQIESTKTDEKFKFKASGSAIGRITEVRALARVAIVEGERDFQDFGATKTGKALVDILGVLDRQEGLIRLAENSKHGYKIVDKVQETSSTYAYLKDPELIKKIKAAEKDLDNEAGKAPFRGRKRSRSRSRSRSHSRTRSTKKKGSPARKRGSFECYWCSRQGHSYKTCRDFLEAAARDGVEYDFNARRFVRKDGRSVSGPEATSSSSTETGSGSRDPYVRRGR
jgi:hypothetical protein